MDLKNGVLNAPMLHSVVQQAKELQACARDQRAAMQDLREGISRLQQELNRSNGAMRPPSLATAWGRRR